jgi:hypothetical protein
MSSTGLRSPVVLLALVPSVFSHLLTEAEVPVRAAMGR